MTNGGEALMAGLSKARNYVDLFDCKVICGSSVINAHKVILMIHSDYFKAAWKPGTFKEGESGEIELKDDNSEMVELMISFFYNLTYSCSNTTDETNNSNDATTMTPHEDIITHASMFALAVKYQAKELRHFAKCSFRHAVQTAWESDEFADALDIVFTSTPEDVSDLRDIVLDTIYDHFQAIMDKPEIKEFICSHGEVSYGLLRRRTNYSQHWPEATESECAVCHQTYRDSELAPGLPKMCMQCNNGQVGWT